MNNKEERRKAKYKKKAILLSNQLPGNKKHQQLFISQAPHREIFSKNPLKI